MIVGHVDTKLSGPGALFHLGSIRPGEGMTVQTAMGPVRYRVAARRAYSKADLPSEIFTARGTPRLVVITCGGRFDRSTGHYDSNVVVYAVPV